MNPTFGEYNAELTQAINRVAREDSSRTSFTRHAEREMANDGFDHQDVFECLRNGKAHGPETVGGELRANVIHRGLHIRVVVGSIQQAEHDWGTLTSQRVVTVMENR